MRKYLRPVALGGVTIALLVLLIWADGRVPPPVQAAMIIATPTSANLLVCVNLDKQVQADAGGSGSVAYSVCNTPSAGGVHARLINSGGRIVIDNMGQENGFLVNVYLVDGATGTTAYTLTFTINLDSASAIVSSARAARTGDTLPQFSVGF